MANNTSVLKKAIPVVVIVVLVAIIVFITISRGAKQQKLTVYEGNHARQPVDILLGQYQGAKCGMNIQQIEDSAQAVAPDGKTWFFDDVGCLAQWLDTNKLKDEMVLWVYARDTRDWVDGRRAWYSRADETPMGYGFAAYSEKQAGLIDFDEMVAKMLADENLTNPIVRKELLGDH